MVLGRGSSHWPVVVVAAARIVGVWMKGVWFLTRKVGVVLVGARKRWSVRGQRLTYNLWTLTPSLHSATLTKPLGPWLGVGQATPPAASRKPRSQTVLRLTQQRQVVVRTCLKRRQVLIPEILILLMSPVSAALIRLIWLIAPNVVQLCPLSVLRLMSLMTRGWAWIVGGASVV